MLESVFFMSKLKNDTLINFLSTGKQPTESKNTYKIKHRYVKSIHCTEIFTYYPNEPFIVLFEKILRLKIIIQ